jgi:hypothetical protein
MIDGIQTVNGLEREAIYDKIQKRLVEELFTWAYISTGKGRVTHDIELTNYPYNAMGYLFLFECGWQGDTWSADFNTGTPALVEYDIPVVEDDAPPVIPGFGVPLTLFAALSAVALVIMKKKRNA